jgi:hypothetical protein
LEKGQQYFELAHEFVGSFEFNGVSVIGIGLVFTAAKKQTQDKQKEDKACRNHGNHCECKSRTPRTKNTFATNVHMIGCTHQTEWSSVPQKTLAIGGGVGNVQLGACLFRTTSFFGN